MHCSSSRGLQHAWPHADRQFPGPRRWAMSMPGAFRVQSGPRARLLASPRVLPNFLIIGAAKSGTTSLWSYVDEHPQVFVAEKKELNFFTRPDWRQRVDWYA